MSRKEPEREFRVLAIKAQQKIEVVGLTDGAVAYSIELTVDQAVQHIRTLVDAVDMVRAAQGMPKKSGVILPGSPAFN